MILACLQDETIVSLLEIVLTTYISAAIAQRIKSVSKAACLAVERDDLYTIGGRWGSKNRVEFAH